MNVFQLKMAVKTVGDELASKEKEISAKAADPNAPISDLKALKDTKADLKERYDILKAQLEEAEAAQKESFQNNENTSIQGMTDPKDKMVAATAEFIRASIYNKPLSPEAKTLIAIPKGNQTGGDNFLPTTMTKELVHEPFARNQLREVANLTNIKGLELPRISYELDDDDFITDEQTAKELEMKGDKVSFGRNKFKVKARISDTVLHGSDVELVTYVQNALRSGLAAKEKKDALASTPKTGLEHMSFYNGEIKNVTGTDLYEAILAGIADLHEDYRENAKIIMRYADYLKIIKILSNGTTSFHNAPPEQVLGKPVEFSDSAVKPIVGDFNYFGINYDGSLIYDSDKDVDKGEYIFVLTAWYDQQRSLDSAFRVVEVDTTP